MNQLSSELKKLRSLVEHIDRKVGKKVDSSKIKESVNGYIFVVELIYGEDMRKANSLSKTKG